MTEVINSEVITQINKRVDVLKKFSNRTNEDLFYLGSKTGWVRVISSANVDAWDPSKATGYNYIFEVDPSSNTGTASLAQQYMLTGITWYKQVDDVTEQIGGRKGINYTGKDNTSFYNFDQLTGFRPVPGIVDFSIASKNTFGTIREATVNFVVWSLEELNYIEKLYFRPGYSVVIEWGHSLYVDNEGKFVESPDFDSNLIDFFQTIPFDEVSTAIIEGKSKHSFNYDAIIGLIKNFSWSFRSDGGYDCSISVTSLGEVLESLTVRLPPPVIPRVTDDESDNKKMRTFLDLFIHELEQITSLSEITINDFSDSSYVKKSLISRGVVRTTDILACRMLLDSEGLNIYYIPLRVLLTLLNVSFAIGYDNSTCEPFKSLVSFDTRPYAGGEYNTFPDHFSLDPMICILPKIPSLKKNILNSSGKVVEADTNISIQKDDLHKKIINGYASIQPDTIPNINITTDLVKKTLDGYLTPTGDYYEFNVYSFTKAILEEINRALGITELDLNYDEETFLYTVVDRKRTLDSNKIEVPEITLAGLESPLLNVQIQSKISNKLGSLISIAAQGSRTNYLQNTGLWTQYNRGIIDRHARTKEVFKKDCFDNPALLDPEKKKEEVSIFETFFNWLSSLYTRLSNTQQIPEEEKTEFAKFIETAEKAYLAFNTMIIDDTRSGIPIFRQVSAYNSELFLFLKNAGPRFFNEIMGNFLDENKQPERGLIPVELSMTMDGISGLKIGQNFKIRGEFIPEKFNNYGYIITGLDHSVKDNRWITNIKTQTFLLKNDNLTGEMKRDTEIPTSNLITGQSTTVTYSTSNTAPSQLTKELDQAIRDLNMRSPFLSSKTSFTRTIIPPGPNRHDGIDASSQDGIRDIVAVAEGVVLSVTPTASSGGYGNIVRLDHGNGIQTWYAHLNSVAKDIVAGTRVLKGRKLGIEGTTGKSDGVHLHFEILAFKGNTKTVINPCLYLPQLCTADAIKKAKTNATFTL